MVVTDKTDSLPGRTLFGRLRTLFSQAAQRISIRRETGPIGTAEALAGFATTRAAFIAQKKLYGYLKTRMGTRYPLMFQDEVFVESVDVAKWHVFAACLSDITLHTVSRVSAEGRLTAEQAQELALYCFEAGLAEYRTAVTDEAAPAVWRQAFAERLRKAHWENLANGYAFRESPGALYRWAPIDDALKRYDREIVENSIRFAWAEIIRDFRKRAALAEIADDFLPKASAIREAGSTHAGASSEVPDETPGHCVSENSMLGSTRSVGSSSTS